MINFGEFPLSGTVYVPFQTFSNNGANISISSFSTGSIKIYKNGLTTERTSMNGFMLLGSNGIDFDGRTGTHAFSINLADNSDAGFYSAGGEYFIGVSNVVINGISTNFWAGVFNIERLGGILATLKSQTLKNDIADTILKRDWTSITGEATRSVLNALRFLRNKWSISGSTLTVTKENDTTTAWTSALSADAAASPVIGSDPD